MTLQQSIGINSCTKQAERDLEGKKHPEILGEEAATMQTVHNLTS